MYAALSEFHSEFECLDSDPIHSSDSVIAVFHQGLSPDLFDLHAMHARVRTRARRRARPRRRRQRAPRRARRT